MVIAVEEGPAAEAMQGKPRQVATAMASALGNDFIDR
jgi:hypothetical protein